MTTTSFLKRTRRALGLERTPSCRWVRRNLTAFTDDELAPGAVTQIAEHLDTCSACRHHLARLDEATPRPSIVVPDAWRSRLAAAVEAAVDGELDRRERSDPTPTPVGPRWDWLGSTTPVPRLAVAGYAVLLLASLGVGVGGLWSNGAAYEEPPTAQLASDWVDLPAEQYQPAAYIPTDGWF